MTTVGVAIASIPPRQILLDLALESVKAQTRPADDISVAVDLDREGAAITRNKAWRVLSTDFISFLDDDDEYLPTFLERMLACQEETDADMVYPYFEVIGGADPFPSHFGRQWDPEHPHQTTVSCLWRREALELVGGFPEPTLDGVDAEGHRAGEEFLAVINLSKAGGKIVHLPERLFRWRHHQSNTSGLPGRW